MTQSDKFPINNPSDDKESRDRQLFDSIAAEYARKDRVRSSSIVRRYQLYCALKPLLETGQSLGKIIEIACGIGAPAHYLDGLYDRYIGIDYSQQQIEAAKIFNQGNIKASFMAVNIKSVGLVDAKADIILAVGALHHMTDHTAVFDSLKRLAKPGAYFIAIEPNRGNAMVQILRQLRARLDKGYSEEQQYYLAEELRTLVETGGLTDISVSPEGYFSPPLAQVIIHPQLLTIPLSSLLVAIDKLIDNRKSSLLNKLSWNLVVRARFSG
jgi:ubiquinone/menaquinone biosynthesis C-methylase UbiE